MTTKLSLVKSEIQKSLSREFLYSLLFVYGNYVSGGDLLVVL